MKQAFLWFLSPRNRSVVFEANKSEVQSIAAERSRKVLIKPNGHVGSATGTGLQQKPPGASH
jgi:hypothetical protein